MDFPLRCLLSTLDAMSRKFQVLHYFANDSAIFTLAPRSFLRKTVMTLDGLYWNRTSYPKWAQLLLRESAWLSLYLPHVTTVDSTYVKEWYRKRYGKAPIYIPYGAKVSPRGADRHVLQKFGVDEDKYLLFAGRLTIDKGVHYLIQAFNQLDRIASEFKLIIAGAYRYSSTYESSLRRMAGKNVKLLGWVQGHDMDNLYKGAYLYVTASQMEGTSPALLEAMGSGNCVLVGDIPENLETIGDAGATFRNGDVADLREKMLILLSDYSSVQYFRKKAVERIAKFYSWESVTDQFEGIYESLLSN